MWRLCPFSNIYYFDFNKVHCQDQCFRGIEGRGAATGVWFERSCAEDLGAAAGLPWLGTAAPGHLPTANIDFVSTNVMMGAADGSNILASWKNVYVEQGRTQAACLSHAWPCLTPGPVSHPTLSHTLVLPHTPACLTPWSCLTARSLSVCFFLILTAHVLFVCMDFMIS